MCLHTNYYCSTFYLLTELKIYVRLSAKFITLEYTTKVFTLIGTVGQGLLKIKYAMRTVFVYILIDCFITTAMLIERGTDDSSIVRTELL